MPVEAEMNAVSTRFHPLRVVDVSRETNDAVAVTLQPPPHADFRFTPGQYLTFRRVADGEEQRRSYSICAGLDDGRLRVGIKRVAGGSFSAWAVDHLKPGDVLEAMAPEGRFGLMPDAALPPRIVLGIACGSGITPILSIASSLLAREPAARFVLLYGNRDVAGIMFRDALERLKDRHLSRFAVVHVLSREKHELSALHGRLDTARIAALLPGLVPVDAIDAAFLCGPDGMAEGARLALEGLGLDPMRIQEERFMPAAGALPRARPVAAPEAPPAAMATLTVDGVTRAVPMAKGETVLEAGLRAGLDLPWSCRGGMCCTCRGRVTEGKVAMATNYSLQPWEIEAGFVLTCQARPVRGDVSVDFDAS
jgi:ring-1,2-phenylacetyl-CoA epoxidase subunit PaaE